MNLNRKLQLDLLQAVTQAFPKRISQETLETIQTEYGEDDLDGNVLYLAMHGLLDVKHTRTISGNLIIQSMYPTEKAFDFLADDGGYLLFWVS